MSVLYCTVDEIRIDANHETVTEHSRLSRIRPTLTHDRGACAMHACMRSSGAGGAETHTASSREEIEAEKPGGLETDGQTDRQTEKER